MKKSFIILLHLGFWGCYFLLIVIMLTVYSRTGGNTASQANRVLNAFYSVMLFAFTPSFVSYWLYYTILFPQYLQQKNIFLSIIYGVIISAAASVFGYIVLRYFIESGRIIDMDEGGKNGRSTALEAIAVMTFIGIVCGGVSLVIKGFITWFNEIKLKEMLKEKNHEMEMALIKSKLDPHVLFNTINNIDTLILKDPSTASEYLNKLSDMMRFVLYETTSEKIQLSQEIDYIEKYIDLQKIRTSNDTYVHFSVVGNIGSKMIAPMVFIPFIENAFKHTSNKKWENAITINILIKDETIQLICENKYDPKSVKQRNGGLGNELVQKRLDLIYKGKHSLALRNRDELYSVNLIVPNE